MKEESNKEAKYLKETNWNFINENLSKKIKFLVESLKIECIKSRVSNLDAKKDEWKHLDNSNGKIISTYNQSGMYEIASKEQVSKAWKRREEFQTEDMDNIFNKFTAENSWI